MTAISQKMFYNIWHCHLTHIDMNSLIKLFKIVIKIHLNGLLKPDNSHVCEACIKVNQKQKILRQSQRWVINIYKITHIDIVSSIMSIIYNRFIWYTVCIDDYFWAQHIYFMKRKKKAEKMMYWYLNFLKEHTEHHLLTV